MTKKKTIRSMKDAKPLLREFFQIDSMVSKANERRDEIKSLLMPFIQKKGLDHLDSGDRRLKYVIPTSTEYDLESIKKLIKDPKIKRKAKKHDIDLDEMIIVTETVNKKILEELLAEKIISRKQARKLMTITDSTPYLRSGNVPKSGTK